ncbi:hypothetical protein BJX66DRAFT_330982 [Aspergillus keveii]|uniref:Altered inheritance of mitochondria protein 9, mitochondrial n=1 Tax=Aspergillus keveii TaxID=714993 RepID=A0ABR4FI02_9EURO
MSIRPVHGNEPHAGPCLSSTSFQHLSDLGLGLANHGLAHVQQSPLIPRGPHFGTEEDHVQLLQAAMKIITKFAEFPPFQRLSRPTLWHGDLHLGNIFVSREDPTMIVGITDWQFVSTYKFGLVKPELPSNFEEMDEDKKVYAESERGQALLSKCYEVALAKAHPEAYSALTKVDPAVRDLFSLTENTWKDGVVPLRDSLIQISDNWYQTGISEPCPYQITSDDASKHNIELSRYKDWQTLKGYTQELLQSDDDGWVNPQLDSDKSETETIPQEEAKALWFYIDRT